MPVSYSFAVLFSTLLISQEPISSLFLLLYAVCVHLGGSVGTHASKACANSMNLSNPVQT